MNNKFKDTASRLLGISDDWTFWDIKEHLEWLIENPSEIVDGYNKSVFKESNIDRIMDEVADMKKNDYNFFQTV